MQKPANGCEYIESNSNQSLAQILCPDLLHSLVWIEFTLCSTSMSAAFTFDSAHCALRFSFSRTDEEGCLRARGRESTRVSTRTKNFCVSDLTDNRDRDALTSCDGEICRAQIVPACKLPPLHSNTVADGTNLNGPGRTLIQSRVIDISSRDNQPTLALASDAQTRIQLDYTPASPRSSRRGITDAQSLGG